MNTHSKAKLAALSRAEMIRRIDDLHQPVADVAAAFGVSERTAYKWLARFRAEGPGGLLDRSSRPKCSPRTLHPFRVARVLALRRRRLPGFQIARAAKLSPKPPSPACSTAIAIASPCWDLRRRCVATSGRIRAN